MCGGSDEKQNHRTIYKQFPLKEIAMLFQDRESFGNRQSAVCFHV